jgi:hypothetical protein
VSKAPTARFIEEVELGQRDEQAALQPTWEYLNQAETLVARVR